MEACVEAGFECRGSRLRHCRRSTRTVLRVEQTAQRCCVTSIATRVGSCLLSAQSQLRQTYVPEVMPPCLTCASVYFFHFLWTHLRVCEQHLANNLGGI